MEVGPTCHYVMGGVEVEPDTAAAVGVQGLFSAGEAAGGLHGSNRLGGNSLSDLLVFGRRAGLGAVAYLADLDAGGGRPAVSQVDVDAAVAAALAPFSHDGGENPYTIQQDLQQLMNDLVGIIRTADEMRSALEKLAGLKARAATLSVPGARAYNPGWHLALDLQNMLVVSECIARSALVREESRGGHTRDDFPVMDSNWRSVVIACRLDGKGVEVVKQDIPWMRDELITLFDVSELRKYMTEAEIHRIPKEVA